VSTTWWREPGAAWRVVGVTGAVGVLLGLVLSPQSAARWLAETGPVEGFTAITFAAAGFAVWGLRRHPPDDRRSSLALSIAMFACCARELDWHKAFTGTSVLRVSWYGSTASPLSKAVAALILLVIATALVWLLLRHWRPWREALRRREPEAVTIAAFFVALVVSKVLDRSVGILVDDFGVHVPERLVILRSAVEECLELALSALVLLGLVQHRAGR
jgi:uncharacterized membrane protein YidH (DUF202 family)